MKPPMLATRTLSALVIGPLCLICFWLGGYYFLGLVAFIAAWGSFEYRRLLGSLQVHVPISLMPAASAVACSGWFDEDITLSFLMLGAMALLTESLARKSMEGAVWGLAGIIYLGVLPAALSMLRASPHGREWSLFVLLVTWATDVGAYFGGSAFGRHKLAPHISPGKSWEGAAAGIICAVALGSGLAGFLGLARWIGAVGAGAISVLAQAGDLSESMLKRYCRAKDSGTLIPGHGGLLDRVDSLLFSAAGGMLFAMLVGQIL